MAKKSFSGGLNSLLGDTKQVEKLQTAEQKQQKKKLLNFTNRHERKRNKSYFIVQEGFIRKRSVSVLGCF
jgi:hypothetical protein